jgi:hypothetical protein
MSRELFLGALSAGVVAAILAGCAADTSSSSGGFASAGPVPTASGSSSGAGDSSQPILADIDTNGTLVSTAGQGIGVYVTYESGGHWQVAWTCDTAITNVACHYVVTASVADVPTSGEIVMETITNVSGTVVPDVTQHTTGTEVAATATTTTSIDSMTFDAPPGAILQVQVQLDGPVSFFFVQDNKVNGGYTGTLTNPMMFQPSSP